MKHAANAISIARILAAIALFFITPFSKYFITLYVLCGLSDIVDGPIARRTDSVSDKGDWLDSLADKIFVYVCLFRILPEIKVPVWLWAIMSVILALRVWNIIIGYRYQNRFVMLHTRANKIAALLFFLLPLSVRIIDIRIASVPVCLAAIYSAIQESYFIKTGRVL